MSPLVVLMLSICFKDFKVEGINFKNEEIGQLTTDEELQELMEDGYYEYKVDEVEHEVNYMSIRIFTRLELRIAVSDRRRFWPNGIVPYVISKKYDSKHKKIILEGMEAFKNRTCIRFTPRKNESAFIFIQQGFGCSSTIGKVNKNIVKVSNGCYQEGIVIHELMHALGFLHEQSRTDRDEFVKINYDNIKEDRKKNFDKYPQHLIQTGNISYDYESIMHYGPFTFAKNKSIPTIIPLQKGVTIGQRRDFSKKDIAKINIFYNCSKQARRRFKRHDNERRPSAFFAEPIETPHRRIPPPAFPSNARKVEYGSLYAPAEYSLPDPRPDPRLEYPAEVYQEPVYPSEDRPIPPISYSNPVQAPGEYYWPEYAPVGQPPNPVYRPAEQPKVSYFPESRHSLYPPALPRRVNYSSIDYRKVQEDYYAPPPRDYHRSEFSRAYYTTPGYDRLRYPPIDYQKPVNTRPSYTTAGYRRPSYTSGGYRRPSYTTAGYRRPSYTTAGYRRPVNYPKIGYPPVYSSPSYYDRYPPVRRPYTQPQTTFVTVSPQNRSEATTTTEITTTATTDIGRNTDNTTPGKETTPTTTSNPTTTAAPTTTSNPTTTAAPTTTSNPTTTVAVTTTVAPTTNVVTTTSAPTSTVGETTTAVAVTTSSESTGTSTITTTVGTTTSSFVSLSPLGKEEEYYTHYIRYHRIHVFPDIESRTALTDPTALWTGGIVPYEFSDKYDGQQKGFLLDAMREFHNKTCVRFVPRRNEAEYILVEPEFRCSAKIGKEPGTVNRVTISEGCYLQGTIIHELMHTLGFIHEQNRPDRDQYVIVMWDNIIEEAKMNFRKYSWDEVQDFGQGYDYESIMHYSSTEFAKDPDRPTLVPLQAGVDLGQREGFSKKDLAKINRLYNCRLEQEREVASATPVEEFKKYFQSNVLRLFRSLLRAIQNFRPSKPKNS